jgi:peptidoglycan/LPS O-acetylase OafA/YrhL
MIPFLFEASKSVRWDQMIGDLSYPLYAVHFLVGYVVAGDAWEGTPAHHVQVLWISLASAAALVFTVEKPVDRLRAWIARRRRQSKHAPGLMAGEAVTIVAPGA